MTHPLSLSKRPAGLVMQFSSGRNGVRPARHDPIRPSVCGGVETQIML
jgi:hypothetical protein